MVNVFQDKTEPHNMEEIDPKILELIKAFLYSIIPTLITLYLTEKVKGKINSKFERQIENLKKDHAIEISKFETELNSMKAKENFKFTKLHEKRMEVLEKTYKYLNDALLHLNYYVSPLKQTSVGTTFEELEIQLHDKFRVSQNLFSNYFSDNRIYFDEEMEKVIDEFMRETISVFNDYYQNHFLKQVGEPFDRDATLKASVAYKRISEKIIPLKKEIEVKFKILLEK